MNYWVLVCSKHKVEGRCSDGRTFTELPLHPAEWCTGFLLGAKMNGADGEYWNEEES